MSKGKILGVAFIIIQFFLACNSSDYPPLNEKLLSSMGNRVKSGFLAELTTNQSRILEDSTDVNAWIGLAESQILLHIFGYASREETLPGAREAYHKALQLASHSSRVIALEGKLSMLDWNWKEAQDAFRRAILTDPRNLDARHWYSLYFAALGQFERAMAHSDTISGMDPAGSYRIGRGSLLYFTRRNEELRNLMTEVIETDTLVAWGYDWLGMAYAELKAYDQSIRTYYKAFELSDGTVEVGGGLGHALGLAGEYTKARQIAEFYQDQSEDHYLPPVQRAFIHIGLGDHDQAIGLLEEAFKENSWFLIFIQVEPWYDPIRDDERFETLIRNMKFPDP